MEGSYVDVNKQRSKNFSIVYLTVCEWDGFGGHGCIQPAFVGILKDLAFI